MESTVVVGVVGILGTLGAALGTRWMDYRYQDRVREREHRLEAHHAFLNRVNRLIDASAAVVRPTPGADPYLVMTNFREALANTVDTFNRIEFVSTQETYDLAVKIMQAAHVERMLKPDEYEGVVRAIGEASRTYRDAVKAELRGSSSRVGFWRRLMRW